MTDGGKGSSPRPFSVSQKEYDTRWDAIFRREELEDNKEDAFKSELIVVQNDKLKE